MHDLVLRERPTFLTGLLTDSGAGGSCPVCFKHTLHIPHALCTHLTLCRRLSQMEAMDQCAAPSNGAMKSLKADSTTAVWGYFYQGIEPAMVASSGDEIMVEMITHHAGRLHLLR